METDMDPIPDIPCGSVDSFSDQGIALEYALNDFWDALRPSLRDQGIYLYDLGRADHEGPNTRAPKEWCTPLKSTWAPLPYARCVDAREVKSRKFLASTRLACAQDSAGRDLMLKLVDRDSDQYRIYDELLDDIDNFTDFATFPCVLPPTGIFDTPHNYSIVSMPMWGNTIYLDDICDVGELFRFMVCLLDGLVFLHSKRIAHRDICEYNIVTNCYRLDQDQQQLQEDLHEHRRRNDVIWALMDYDQSIKHPKNVSLKHFRRPVEEAWSGSVLYRPDDVRRGEPYYHPFPFDVAMLGNLFCVHFWAAVAVVPSLAMLYDRMTTHVISQRFTAEEARMFLQDELRRLAPDICATPLDLKVNFNVLENSEMYRSMVPVHLKARWYEFRTPPRSLGSTMLDHLMGYPTLRKIIILTRRIIGV
ncbi:hypothetical protein C8Q74DRAFT_1263745 [Fomes fomentarius]|nr:hypothetical protein C8Q74DRAFT_1263745 [Fomes fomentarius]